MGGAADSAAPRGAAARPRRRGSGRRPWPAKQEQHQKRVDERIPEKGREQIAKQETYQKRKQQRRG